MNCGDYRGRKFGGTLDGSVMENMDEVKEEYRRTSYGKILIQDKRSGRKRKRFGGFLNETKRRGRNRDKRCERGRKRLIDIIRSVLNVNNLGFKGTNGVLYVYI